jgi:hypothetical protein
MTPYHYGKLLDLLLDVKKDITELKEQGATNVAELKEHARRTTAAEKRQDLQEKKLDQFIKNMEPVEDHVKFMHKLSKLSILLLGAGASIAGIITLILKIKT